MDTIPCFRTYLTQRVEREPLFLAGLKGKRLGCFCAPWPCHGDVYVEFLEGQEPSIAAIVERMVAADVDLK